jgi:ribosome-binding protein aMBF1 (putative translation factor)
VSAEDEESSVYDETLSRTSAEVETPETERDLAPSKRIVRTSVVETKSVNGASIPDDSAQPSRPESAEFEVHTVQSTGEPVDESVSASAREAGRSFKDLARSVAEKTKRVARQKTAELKAESVESGTAADANDIRDLGEHVDTQVQLFEDTMLGIGKEPYSERERMLTGYHKLLEEQINVIDARLELARRLKAA